MFFFFRSNLLLLLTILSIKSLLTRYDLHFLFLNNLFIDTVRQEIKIAWQLSLRYSTKGGNEKFLRYYVPFCSFILSHCSRPPVIEPTMYNSCIVACELNWTDLASGVVGHWGSSEESRLAVHKPKKGLRLDKANIDMSFSRSQISIIML